MIKSKRIRNIFECDVCSWILLSFSVFSIVEFVWNFHIRMIGTMMNLEIYWVICTNWFIAYRTQNEVFGMIQFEMSDCIRTTFECGVTIRNLTFLPFRFRKCPISNFTATSQLNYIFLIWFCVLQSTKMVLLIKTKIFLQQKTFHLLHS